MTAFIALSLAAIAAVFAWLWRPFWRGGAPSPQAQRATADQINTAIYRDQLARLDQDVADGVLSAQDRDAARTELQRRALHDVAEATHAASNASGGTALRTPNRLLGISALLITVSAAGLYAMLGSPMHIVHPGGTPPQTVTTSDGQQLDLQDVVAKLAARMEQNPTDLKGWSMLGLSYKVMGKLPEAEKAFERAGDFINDDARMLASYADVAAANRGGQFDGKPQQLIDQALKVDPNHGLALWLAGTAQLQAGKFDAAIATWGKLMKQLPPDSPDAQMLQGAINDAEQQKKGGNAPAGSEKLATKSEANTTSSSPGTATTAADKPAAAATGALVQGQVSLDASVQAKAPPNATLMVIARRPGERMPLAVLRVPAGQWPAAFTLNDALSMNPATPLSSAAEVEVLARLSQSGMAVPQAGDLFSDPQTVKLGAQNLRLNINHVRE